VEQGDLHVSGKKKNLRRAIQSWLRRDCMKVLNPALRFTAFGKEQRVVAFFLFLLLGRLSSPLQIQFIKLRFEITCHY
jgi:hypothetical protein